MCGRGCRTRVVVVLVPVLLVAATALGQHMTLGIGRGLVNIPSEVFIATLTEVWIGIGKEQVSFLREQTLDWSDWDSPLEIRFFWKTAQPGARSAIYQISTLEFAAGSALTLAPPGLVASGTAGPIPPAGGWGSFSVDFRTFAPIPPGEVRPSSNAVETPRWSPSVKSGAVQFPVFGSSPAIPQVSHAAAMTLIRYFVRVVTLDSAMTSVGTPSTSVTVLYGRIPRSTGTTTTYYGQAAAVHPSVHVTGYVPIQTQDPEAIYHYVATRDTDFAYFDVRKGDAIYLAPYEDEPEFWSSLSSAIGQVVSSSASFAESAVTWVAAAYDDIKSYAIDAAVLVAGEDARGLLTMGLEIGLAAMGLPPSLPNYDELTRMGRDYLVKAAADYAGVPPHVAAYGVDAFIAEASRYASTGGNADMWLKPNPEKYYRPAYINLVAVNTSGQPTDAVRAEIKVTVPHGTSTAELFLTAYPFIPTLAPGELLFLPVYLEEHTSFPPPFGYTFGGESPYAAMRRFWEAYNSLSATVSVTTCGRSTVANPYQLQEVLTIPDCRLATSFGRSLLRFP